jgi:hypothetical protein
MLCNFVELWFIVFWVAINFFVLFGLLKITGRLTHKVRGHCNPIE